MKRLILGLLLLNCFGCRTEEDVFGVYVKQPSDYTIDSLFLIELEQGNINSNITSYKYSQKLYDKLERKLLLENSGRWYLRHGGITFENFFWHNDSSPLDSLSKINLWRSVLSYGTTFNGSQITIDDGVYYNKVK